MRALPPRKDTTHDRNIKVILVFPRLVFWLDDIDLGKYKRLFLPYVSKHFSSIGAEAAVFSGKEGHPAGLEQPGGDTHFQGRRWKKSRPGMV